ncbi:unnamed protein product [Acanthoscelides obtectus]|uniref:Uncharacterized protein n=1 Tax=Acanthoscelides obtectus TaxID=200917 RepID=A0A9P0LMY1_ACAOB|nr:unnamed protein product [Acanthoscelides obtectus]CAK1652420.1 Pro-resilin [Acanthoscelides obtectus]
MQNFALENIGMMKKNYAFSYNVVDSATGDDFSHSQVHTAQKTKGEYRVKLPDGRVQIVKYTADKNGYKADVRYEEGGSAKTLHEESNGHPNKIPMTATVQLQLLPSNSIHRAYYQDARRTDTGSSFTTAHPSVSRPTHVPAYHPVQLHGLGAHKGRQDEQVADRLDVEMYTSNAKDYRMRYYPIPRNAPSLHHTELKEYPNIVISPDVISYAESGIVIPVTNHNDNNLVEFVATPTPVPTPTPTAFLVLDHHGQIVDTYRLVAPSTAASSVAS